VTDLPSWLSQRAYTGAGASRGGIIRRKDAVKITALSGALETGTAVSRFTKRDCAVFAEFVAERDRRYPHYRAFVHLVDEVLATVPPSAASSIRYFVMPAAKATVAKMNRTRRHPGCAAARTIPRDPRRTQDHRAAPPGR
jgi:hypothetical protein